MFIFFFFIYRFQRFWILKIWCNWWFNSSTSLPENTEKTPNFVVCCLKLTFLNKLWEFKKICDCLKMHTIKIGSHHLNTKKIKFLLFNNMIFEEIIVITTEYFFKVNNIKKHRVILSGVKKIKVHQKTSFFDNSEEISWKLQAYDKIYVMKHENRQIFIGISFQL